MALSRMRLTQAPSRLGGPFLRKHVLTSLPPRLSLVLLVAALGGTFAEPLVPWAEPRALNYLLILAACFGLMLSRLVRKPTLARRLSIATFPIASLLLVATTILIAAVALATMNDPLRLLKTGFFVLVTLPCAVLTARLLEPEELVSTVFAALLMINALSVVLAIAAPAIGTMDFVRGTAWSGIYGQKNALGRQAALLGIVSLLLMMSAPSRTVRLLAGSGLMLAIVVALFSLSRTSQVLLVSGGLLVLAIGLMPKYGLPLAGIACLLGLIALEALVLQNVVLLETATFGVILIDHPVDLTGRLPVWNFSWWLFGEHPVFGAGFDALWFYDGGSALYDHLGWRVTDSHNGFLDLLVQAGLSGAILYGAGLLLVFIRAIRLLVARCQKTLLEALLITFVPLTILVNLTSSQITEILSLWNFLFLVVCFASDRTPARAALQGKSHAALHHHHPLSKPASIAG